MSKGYCLHCGLLIETPTAFPTTATLLHPHCVDAWNAEQAFAANCPKSQMEQQLDRIEEKLDRIVSIFKADEF